MREPPQRPRCPLRPVVAGACRVVRPAVEDPVAVRAVCLAAQRAAVDPRAAEAPFPELAVVAVDRAGEADVSITWAAPTSPDLSLAVPGMRYLVAFLVV